MWHVWEGRIVTQSLARQQGVHRNRATGGQEVQGMNESELEALEQEVSDQNRDSLGRITQ